MGLIAQFKRWKVAHKERRIERLTAQAADLTKDQRYDLLFLHQRGFVRAKGSGQSITNIYVDVENLIRKELRVIVAPGTYFVSSGQHQNMATTTEYTFTLYPCSTQHLNIRATCINANLPIPGKADRFCGVARVTDNVARFLEASKNEGPMVIQAGVWTLTDNLTRHDVINHLISRDNLGFTSHPVTDDDCDRASDILDELGISHRLWRSPVAYEMATVKYGDDVYEGELRHGIRSGRGTYTWGLGGYYEGEWKDGKMHGQGTRVWQDGSRYVGAFDNNKVIGGFYEFDNNGPMKVFGNESQKFRGGPFPRGK